MIKLVDEDLPEIQERVEILVTEGDPPIRYYELDITEINEASLTELLFHPISVRQMYTYVARTGKNIFHIHLSLSLSFNDVLYSHNLLTTRLSYHVIFFVVTTIPMFQQEHIQDNK